MPEMLTKYPDSAIAVLKSAGAKCDEGIKPQILTKCPKDHFCALPQGEICVYSPKDLTTLTTMTQLNPAELADVVNQVPTIYSNINLILLMVSCLFGLVVGMYLK